MWKWCAGLVTVFIMVAPLVRAADPPTGDAAKDAEIRMLNSAIERQRREITALKARIAELTAQLQSLGIAPAGSPTTQPTPVPAARPKRIVFVLDTYNCYPGCKFNTGDEVIKAVSELGPDQWFNVIFRPFPHADPIVLRETMLPVTDMSRAQLQRFFKGKLSPSPDALPAMALALKWKPDLIWYVGGGPSEPEQFLEGVRKLNAHAKVRINTTIQFMPPGSPKIRFFWLLAHESGGVCLDESGKILPEPPVAMKIELPKPTPASKPSILRNP